MEKTTPKTSAPAGILVSDKIGNVSGIYVPPNMKGEEKNEPIANVSTGDVTVEGSDSSIKADELSAAPAGMKIFEQPTINTKIDRFKTSYVEDHEVEEAKKIIEESLGFEVPRVCGYHMVVKIFVRPEDVHEFTDEKGNKKSIYLPESATAQDKFRSCVALVLNQGPECYTGKRFQENPVIRFFRKTGLFKSWLGPIRKRPWCKVGDWVVIARNAGPQVNYRGMPVTYLPDDQIFGVVPDPTFVTRD